MYYKSGNWIISVGFMLGGALLGILILSILAAIFAKYVALATLAIIGWMAMRQLRKKLNPILSITLVGITAVCIVSIGLILRYPNAYPY